MKNGLPALLVLLTLTPVIATEIPPSLPLSGFARYESSKWLFRRCIGNGKTSTLELRGAPFVDATPGRLLFTAVQERWRQSADPLRGIYLEFAGYAENGRITATELHRSLGWVASCAERPTNLAASARLWAAGNEPAWSFVVDGKAATFKTPDGVRSFQANAIRQDGDIVLYESGNASVRIRVELSPGLCSDTMSEAAFGRRAVVAIDRTFYTGCGLMR